MSKLYEKIDTLRQENSDLKRELEFQKHREDIQKEMYNKAKGIQAP